LLHATNVEFFPKSRPKKCCNNMTFHIDHRKTMKPLISNIVRKHIASPPLYYPISAPLSLLHHFRLSLNTSLVRFEAHRRAMGLQRSEYKLWVQTVSTNCEYKLWVQTVSTNCETISQAHTKQGYQSTYTSIHFVQMASVCFVSPGIKFNKSLGYNMHFVQ